MTLHAYRVDAYGLASAISDHTQIGDGRPDEGYIWLHLCALCAETQAFLLQQLGLDDIVVDALMAEETRPRALLKDDGVMVILRGMNLNPDADPEDMISLRLWMEGRLIVTTRRRDIRAIGDVVEQFDNGQAPQSPAEFLVSITDRLYQRMGPVLEDLEDRLSAAEEQLALDEYDPVVSSAAAARKQTAIFTRYITPQRALLRKLCDCQLPCLNADAKEHLVESHDLVTRYVEELHEIRDRSQILSDELSNVRERKLSESTYIFSVVATIFLPLGFITGLLGVNVGGVPGVEQSTAFWLLCGLCVGLVAIQVVLFKWRGWF